MKRNNTFIPRDNLVAEYLLNGSANDTAGSNNGTATNITRVDSDRGYVNQCASFNGSSSYIDCGAKLIGAGNPISIFIKPDVLDSGQRFLSQMGGASAQLGDGYIRIVDSSGHLSYTLMTGSSNGYREFVTTSLTVPIGKYSHVVAIPNSTATSIDFYVNGIKETVSSSTSGSYTWTSGNTEIGRLNNGVYFDGDIQLFRPYNTALTQSEINSLYQEGLRKLGPTNLIGNNGDFQKYSTPNLEKDKVLEISRPAVGGIYYDQSGNNHNGTATNVTDSTEGFNNVMTFNGSTSKVALSTSLISNTGDVTISCWFNADTIGGTMGTLFVDERTTAYKCICGRVIDSGGKKLHFLNSNNTSWIEVQTIETGKRYHFTLVRHSTGYRAYVNGVLITTDSSTATTTQSGVFTNIGYREPAVPNVFDGNISNVKIHNRVLSPEEVQQDFYSNYIN